MPERDLLPRLREMIEKKAGSRGDITLTSGLKANYYFNLKRVLGLGEGAYLIGNILLPILKRAEIRFVGGGGLGGRWMSSAVVTVSSFSPDGDYPGDYLVSGFDIEDNGEIRGHLPPVGESVAVVDDVLTTGGSLLEAIKILKANNRRVAKVIVLLDRQQGGLEELRRRGYDVIAIFRADVISGKVYIND